MMDAARLVYRARTRCYGGEILLEDWVSAKAALHLVWNVGRLTTVA
jgi:hypothetical protein